MSNLENYFSVLCQEMIDVWENGKDETKIWEIFSKLKKEEIEKLMDCFLDEFEVIKTINRVIRTKETLNTIFDYKLLYTTLKSCVLDG